MTLKAIQNDKSFTLVEMVLVVVLLAVLAVFAVPNMQKPLNRILLRRVAGDAAGLMRYAQGRAVLRGVEIRFDLDRRRQCFRIAQEKEQDSFSPEEGQSDIPGRWGKTIKVPAPVQCDLDREGIVFYPDGKADQGRLVCCHETRCRTVSTREQRGRVLLIEGRVE